VDQATTIDKVGFFHFVERHDRPIWELRKALQSRSAHEDTSGSLIVLPEAFNIKKRYKESGPADHSRAVLDDLGALCVRFRVTMVAALIVNEVWSPCLSYSSAYWVGEGRPVRICRKRCRDGNEANTPYRRCRHDPDDRNPFRHGDACIIALICEDSDDSVRKQKLLDRCEGSRTIICIPACMASPSGRQAITLNWAPYEVILANSEPCGIGSFIGKRGSIVVARESSEGNAVVLV